MTELQKLTGGGQGMLFIDNAAAATGRRIFAIQVNTDAVITSLLDTSNQNLLTQYNLSGKTLKSGMIITTNGFPISTVTLASGSVLAYLFVD